MYSYTVFSSERFQRDFIGWTVNKEKENVNMNYMIAVALKAMSYAFLLSNKVEKKKSTHIIVLFCDQLVTICTSVVTKAKYGTIEIDVV